MLDGYAYYVVSIETTENKIYAYAQKVHRCNNLYGFFDRTNNIDKKVASVNNGATWKEAKTLAEAWNKAYKENGTYIF